jgi:DNA repair exonuclease SbcCD ATPase subunit
MAKAENYDELIFNLADLARERLANRPNCPQSMQRVFRAEDALVARQEELASLEQQMNDADADWRQYLEELKDERSEKAALVKRFKRAVDSIEGKVKELRKKLGQRRAEQHYSEAALKTEEKRMADLEMSGSAQALGVARENLKKLRVGHLRRAREIQDLERELSMALTPAPGQAGAEGILAHGRLLEIEDELQEREQEFEALMEELDQAIAIKEQEVAAAEDYLDQALFLLGEECYSLRIADPALAALYPRIDRAA